MNFEVAKLITKAFISTYMKLVAEKKTTSRIPPRTDFFLHESIIIEILSRLEPKSVMRFKCVCKHWQYLISYDPIIRDMPLRLKVPCILFGPRYATRPSPVMFSFCGFGVNISSLRLADPLESGTSLVVEDSDNGIVCLSEFSTKTVIYLWNPRSREVKKLPSPKYSPLWESSKFRLGLGYDPLTNDFKVVKLCRYDLREDNLGLFHGTDNRVYIYSLRSNSWKRIQMANIFPPSITAVTYMNYDCSIVVNRSIHWTLYYIEVGVVRERYYGRLFGRVAFDLNTEIFKLIKPPQHILGAFVQPIGKLFECLSFIYHDTTGLTEIWVMKEHGISDSWIKQVTVDLKWPYFRHPHKRFYSIAYRTKVHPYERFYSIAYRNNVYVLICSVSHGLFWYNVNSDSLEYLGPEDSGWI